MIAGLHSLMVKVEMLGTSCIMCAHAFREIPLFHHEGTDAYIQWQENDRYVLHSAAVTVTSSNGVRPKELPEYARPTRNEAQWCAN